MVRIFKVRVLVVLPEDLSSTPSTHVHKCNSSSRGPDPHSGMQAHKIKNCKM